MEGMLFADGEYPDFSLLKEVLSPPCWEASPSKDPHLERQWMQDETLQYRRQPLDVPTGQATPSSRGCASPMRPAEGALKASGEETAAQHCGVASRGSATHRDSSVLENLEPWRPSRGHIHNLRRRRNKMRCLLQIPKPNVIYFLRESLKLLPKVEKREFNSATPCTEDTANQQSNSPMYQPNCPPRLWNYYANSSPVVNHKTSLQSCNEMELLNLISIKCSRLGKAGRWQEDGAREDPQLKIHQGGFRGSDGVLRNASNGNKGPDVPLCADPNQSRNKNNINPQTVCEERGSCDKEKVKVPGEREDKTLRRSCPFKNGQQNLLVPGRKSSRKQTAPVKSAEKDDPSFRGVEFRMRMEKEHGGDYRLIVTSLYRRVKQKSTKKSKRGYNVLSSGSDDDQLSSFARRTKQCASCKTQKTPLWRDAEDGTPLCNACGIRYKKYGVRCYDCWNIPKRDGKTCSRYCECGGTFRAQP